MRLVRSDRKSKRARRAIAILFRQLEQHPEDAARILEHVRAYSLRHRVPVLASERILYCPACMNVYPTSAKRRIRGASIYLHCPCGALRRLRARTKPTNRRNARNEGPNP
ncbi:MAG: hypothetical protein ACMXYM_00920 [Candidatus Woesearchaeota archaeon]